MKRALKFLKSDNNEETRCLKYNCDLEKKRNKLYFLK